MVNVSRACLHSVTSVVIREWEIIPPVSLWQPKRLHNAGPASETLGQRCAGVCGGQLPCLTG